MRGMFGRLCHGNDRRPREPHGVLAPLLRTVACAAWFAGSLVLLAAVTAVPFHGPLAGLLALLATVPLMVAACARTVAAMSRPEDVTLTVWDSESTW